VTSPREEPDSATEELNRLMEELNSARQVHDVAVTSQNQAMQDGESRPERLGELDLLCMAARLRVMRLEWRLGLRPEQALASAEEALESTRSRLHELRESRPASDPPPPPYESAPRATANEGTARGSMPGEHPDLPLLPPEVWLEQQHVQQATANQGTGRGAMPGQYPGLALLPIAVWLERQQQGQQATQPTPEPQQPGPMPGHWPDDDDDRLQRRALLTEQLQRDQNRGDDQNLGR
jgi:hypothetical protein